LSNFFFSKKKIQKKFDFQKEKKFDKNEEKKSLNQKKSQKDQLSWFLKGYLNNSFIQDLKS